VQFENKGKLKLYVSFGKLMTVPCRAVFGETYRALFRYSYAVSSARIRGTSYTSFATGALTTILTSLPLGLGNWAR
jgi:hypothetical protein